MPESTGVYRIIAGRRYEFPSEEAASQWDARREARMQQRAEQESGLSLSQFSTGIKSILPGFIRGVGLVSTGFGSALESESAKDFGKLLEEKAKQTSELFMDPYQRYTSGAMYGETLGAMIPGALGTLAAAAAIPETAGASATLIPALVGGVIGGLQGAGEVGSDIREARARGQQISPEQERNLALIQGGITGLLESGGGALLGRAVKGVRGLTAAGRAASNLPGDAAAREVTDLLAATYPGMARRALGFAAEEGISEGAQQLSQNILARGDISSLGPGYDPERDLMAGVLESMKVGAAFGGVLGGGIDLYKKKKLEGFASKMKEAQAQSAAIDKPLESALLSQEVEGQQVEEIVAGILAEKRAKSLDDALTSSVGRASDLELGAKERINAYKEIASQDIFGKLYSELNNIEADEVDRVAVDLFRRNVNPESLAIGIQMKEREAPGAVEMEQIEPPEGMGGVVPEERAKAKYEETESGENRISKFRDLRSKQNFRRPYENLTEEQKFAIDTLVDFDLATNIVESKKRQQEQERVNREGQARVKRTIEEAKAYIAENQDLYQEVSSGLGIAGKRKPKPADLPTIASIMRERAEIASKADQDARLKESVDRATAKIQENEEVAARLSRNLFGRDLSELYDTQKISLADQIDVEKNRIKQEKKEEAKEQSRLKSIADEQTRVNLEDPLRGDPIETRERRASAKLFNTPRVEELTPLQRESASGQALGRIGSVVLPEEVKEKEILQNRGVSADALSSVIEHLKYSPDVPVDERSGLVPVDPETIQSIPLVRGMRGKAVDNAQAMFEAMVDLGYVVDVNGTYYLDPDTKGPMYKLPKRAKPAAKTAPAVEAEEISAEPERGIPVSRIPAQVRLDVEAARKVSRAAYEHLKKLNVSDVYSLVVVDNFLNPDGSVRPEGARFLNNVISLASKVNDIAESEQNLINTINHEVVHGMRQSGFFTDSQWKLMTSTFKPEDEMDEETIQAYRDRFKAKTPEEIDEILKEEAVAHAIERLGNEPAKPLSLPEKSLMQRVKSLARLGTAANNLGYTAEDLISAVRAGDVGRMAAKGMPTVLDAIREGRTPRQLTFQPRQQVGELQEEIQEEPPGYDRAVGIASELGKISTQIIQRRIKTDYKTADLIVKRMQENGIVSPEGSGVFRLLDREVEPVDESNVPPELRGDVPERISREAPEATDTEEEAPSGEESSPMYKIIPQKPSELFIGRKDDSLINMIERGVRGGTPTLDILNGIKDYLFETKVAKAALGPPSELGKAVSARQSVLDQFAPIEKSAENLSQFLGQSGDKYTAANSASIVMVRQSQKHNELLSTMLLEGYAFFDPKTGFILVKKSKDHALMPQLENLAKKGKLYQGLDAAIARRFVETEKGIGNAEDILGGTFTIGDYQAIDAKYAGDADIQEFLRVLRNMNDALIELNRYVGNFDQQTTARYKRFFFSPLYRVPVDKDGYPLAPTASNAKIANLQGLKPIKGAKLPVGDAIENLISNANFMLSYAMKNEAGSRVIRDAVDANIAKATGTAKAVKVRAPRFATDSSRVVRINVKGKQEYYEVLDPLLYQAMAASGFRPSAMDMVGRSFGRAFRGGITRSLYFIFRNMFIDSVNLWSLGIYKGSPIISIPKNLIYGGVSVFNSAFWKTDPALQELASAGLLPSDIAARNAIDTAKNIKKKLKVDQDEALKSFVLNVWDGTVGFMEKLAGASETVNRVQVYKNVLKDMQKAGVSADEAKATALYATMQYPVNFDTRGSGQIASWVASYLPFVSASAQGTDVFYRHIKDMVRTGGVRTLPFGKTVGGKRMSSPLQKSMLEASRTALYQSVIFGSMYSLLMAAFKWEEWKKLPLQERYSTLLVPVPVANGGMVKIPVPQTLGAISLMIPAALAESIMGHENGAEIAKSMAAFFAGMFTFDPTPQFIRPVVEVATNKNFFTWRPIENESLQKLPPQYRYDERTNLLSRYMSKFLNEVAIPISPVQFEHLVRGYLGTLGVFANELISQTVDIGSQNEPERFRPLTDPHLLPGIGKIFLDPDVDKKAIEDYYAIRNAATQAANALKINAASEEFQNNPEALREMLILSRINEAMEAGPEKEMQELRRLKRQVQSAPSSQISPSRKTDVIKKINARMSQIAGRVQHLKRYVPFNAF